MCNVPCCGHKVAGMWAPEVMWVWGPSRALWAQTRAQGQQGWQTLGESGSCVHAGIRDKGAEYTVLEGKRCVTSGMCFSPKSLSQPKPAREERCTHQVVSTQVWKPQRQAQTQK